MPKGRPIFKGSGQLWEQLAALYVGGCLRDETSPRVKEFAARLHLRREQLSRAFTTATGMTPSLYFRRSQIEHSKCLLTESDLTVTTVAYKSGFENRRTFFRFFRRVVGVSPAEFREAARSVSRSGLADAG